MITLSQGQLKCHNRFSASNQQLLMVKEIYMLSALLVIYCCGFNILFYNMDEAKLNCRQCSFQEVAIAFFETDKDKYDSN